MEKSTNRLFTGISIVFDGKRKTGKIKVNSEKFDSDINYQNPLSNLKYLFSKRLLQVFRNKKVFRLDKNRC